MPTKRPPLLHSSDFKEGLCTVHDTNMELGTDLLTGGGAL